MATSELAGKLASLPFRVGENLVTPTTSAKVLGVQLSFDLTMDRQISAIWRAANFNLYRLGKIRSHLTTKATKILVHSLVISHLDYANSLLAELPKEKLRPLQSVRDSAARLIHRGVFSTEESRFRLRWLRIHYRILFKVLLLVFDCLQGTAPVYLQLPSGSDYPLDIHWTDGWYDLISRIISNGYAVTIQMSCLTTIFSVYWYNKIVFFLEKTCLHPI